ncbi:MAG: hypothetical protein HQ559_05875 [Lentisphaerae bacterium]|nr:hypothetical protein [Lentisphaerota bacterium]
MSKDLMSKDQVTVLLLGALYRLCEGDVSKFFPPGLLPKEIKRFLASGPSLPDRRAALVAILQSIITDEGKDKRDQDATNLMNGIPRTPKLLQKNKRM